jgi:hypothetical protein
LTAQIGRASAFLDLTITKNGVTGQLTLDDKGRQESVAVVGSLNHAGELTLRSANGSTLVGSFDGQSFSAKFVQNDQTLGPFQFVTTRWITEPEGTAVGHAEVGSTGVSSANLREITPQNSGLQFTWECPQCGRRVPRQVDRCRCGFDHASANRIVTGTNSAETQGAPRWFEKHFALLHSLFTGRTWTWWAGAAVAFMLTVLFAAASKLDMRYTSLPIVLAGGAAGDWVAGRVRRLQKRKAGMKAAASPILLVLGIGFVVGNAAGVMRNALGESLFDEPNPGWFAFGVVLLLAGWQLRTMNEDGPPRPLTKTITGKVLFFIGIWLTVRMLPEVIRLGEYDDSVFLAFGAMLLTTGWFLSRSNPTGL